MDEDQLTFGRYRVTSQIGKGGMAEVYAAKHAALDRYAAVKLLLPEMSVHQEVVKRFFQEAQAATRIRHPGIIEVFDVGYAANGRAYIVMELLEGESLKERLKRRGALPIDTSVALMRQVTEIIAVAHAHGIIHRDLKPDNIFLQRDPGYPSGERVKVLDFGLAKLATEMSSIITAKGAVFGTPAYMAPEQCRDASNVDERADLYAIGCMLYACLCGKPPFGSGRFEVLLAQLERPPRPPRQLQPAIPDAVDALVMRLLSKNPRHRYQTCAELLEALDECTEPDILEITDLEAADPEGEETLHDESAKAAAAIAQAVLPKQTDRIGGLEMPVAALPGVADSRDKRTRPIGALDIEPATQRLPKAAQVVALSPPDGHGHHYNGNNQPVAARAPSHGHNVPNEYHRPVGGDGRGQHLYGNGYHSHGGKDGHYRAADGAAHGGHQHGAHADGAAHGGHQHGAHADGAAHGAHQDGAHQNGAHHWPHDAAGNRGDKPYSRQGSHGEIWGAAPATTRAEAELAQRGERLQTQHTINSGEVRRYAPGERPQGRDHTGGKRNVRRWGSMAVALIGGLVLAAWSIADSGEGTGVGVERPAAEPADLAVADDATSDVGQHGVEENVAYWAEDDLSDSSEETSAEPDGSDEADSNGGSATDSVTELVVDATADSVIGQVESIMEAHNWAAAIQIAQDALDRASDSGGMSLAERARLRELRDFAQGEQLAESAFKHLRTAGQSGDMGAVRASLADIDVDSVYRSDAEEVYQRIFDDWLRGQEAHGRQLARRGECSQLAALLEQVSEHASDAGNTLRDLAENCQAAPKISRKQLLGMAREAARDGQYKRASSYCQEAGKVGAMSQEHLAMCGLAACKSSRRSAAKRYYRHSNHYNRILLSQVCQYAGIDLEK